jgi:hypothetical protein
MADEPTPTPAPSLGFAGELRKLIAGAVAWEQANPRKTAAGLLFLSTHSSRLKPVVAFLAALLGLQLGCLGSTPTANQAKLDCFVQALDPVVGDVYDTSLLVHDLIAGKADLSAILHNLQFDEAAAKALIARVNACVKPPTVAPDAGKVM